MQEQQRRQQRKHFTALTAGFFAYPFEESNPLAAAALDARTKLLEGIQPRVTSAPDQAASNGDSQTGKQLTPLQRLNAIAEAEVNPPCSSTASLRAALLS